MPSPDPSAVWATLVAGTAAPRLALHGRWRLASHDAIGPQLKALVLPPGVSLDGTDLQQIDSASALLLARALRDASVEPTQVTLNHFEPATQRVLEQVFAQLATMAPTPRARAEGIFAHIGRAAVAMGALVVGHVNFLGQTAAALGHALLHPSSIRPRELSAQIEQAGLNAIPVVALVTLLIGVVFTYLLGLQAEQYGANIFVVDGVAIGTTREFSPILVAVIVAGRSGAAFTAQLGSMRLTEEIDAIRTLGLSPMAVLVLPRVIALMLVLPLLVFVGNVAALGGAMLIADPMLGITPAGFLDRLRTALDMRHVWIGLIKAPVFALFIAIIGCRMGITVGRDTRAVGMATTSTVVQSIVSVILLDAAFAVLFQHLGW